MYLFPDTHFFLHYKHAQEIPWEGVTHAPEIRLVVGRAVAKELDKKKFELRGRPQDRARTYVAKLGAVAISGEAEILRASNPKITLAVRPQRPSGWAPPADLDPTWFDDILLADVLGFLHANPEADVAVLTGDPGLTAKAVGYGVRVLPLVGHGWELADEKTPEEKEIEKLRRENDELKRVGPSFVCDLEVDGSPQTAIEQEVVKYAALDDGSVSALLADLQARHPKIIEFPSPPPPPPALTSNVELKAPTEEEIGAYAVAYDQWLRDAEAFIRAIPDRFGVPSFGVDIAVVIQNLGNEPAKGLHLYMETLGGLPLAEIEDGEAAKVTEGSPSSDLLPSKFRPPPSAPRWKRVVKMPQVSKPSPYGSSIQAALAAANGDWSGLSKHAELLSAYEKAVGPTLGSGFFGDHARSLSSLIESTRGIGFGSVHDAWNASAIPVDPSVYLPRMPRQRDRYSFYRLDVPSSKRGAWIGFECEEFRHKMEPERFGLRISWRYEGSLPRNGAMRVRLSASNARQVFEKTFPVRVKLQEANMRKIAEDLLP